MDAAEQLAPDVGTAAACRAMGVSRATLYRRRNPTQPTHETRARHRQARALDAKVFDRTDPRDRLYAVGGYGASHDQGASIMAEQELY